MVPRLVAVAKRSSISETASKTETYQVRRRVTTTDETTAQRQSHYLTPRVKDCPMLGSFLVLESDLKDLNCGNGKQRKKDVPPQLHRQVTTRTLTTGEDLSRLSGQGRPQQQLSRRSHRCRLRLSEAEALTNGSGNGARNGLIPHYRIGDQIRFDPAELDRWIRQHVHRHPHRTG